MKTRWEAGSRVVTFDREAVLEADRDVPVEWMTVLVALLNANGIAPSAAAISLLESTTKLPVNPDDIVRHCLRGVRGAITHDQYVESSSRIRDAIQNAFDLGFKAAGGSIFPINDKESS